MGWQDIFKRNQANKNHGGNAQENTGSGKQKGSKKGNSAKQTKKRD